MDATLNAAIAALRRNIGSLCPEGFFVAYCTTTGYHLQIKANNRAHKGWALENLLAIATLADGIIPLSTVGVQGSAPWEMANLRRLFPVPVGAGGYCDLALQAGQDKSLRQIVAAYLDCLGLGQSLFVLGQGAIYHEVTLCPESDPPCSGETMIGKPVAAILGEEAHDRINSAIALSLDKNEKTFLLYPGIVRGELRQYTAKIAPLPDAGKALLIVDRIG
jgi:hypothetical protein